MRVIVTVLVQIFLLNRITFSCVRKQENALPGVSFSKFFWRSMSPDSPPQGAQALWAFTTWLLATYRNATVTPLMKQLLKIFLTALLVLVSQRFSVKYCVLKDPTFIYADVGNFLLMFTIGLDITGILIASFVPQQIPQTGIVKNAYCEIDCNMFFFFCSVDGKKNTVFHEI